MSIRAVIVFSAAVLAAYVAVVWVGRWWVRVSAQRYVNRSKRDTPPQHAARAPTISPESLYVVTLSDVGVSCTHPDKTLEWVAWEDLQSVEIVTTDGGPRAVDVFWVLHGTAAGCIVPLGATGERQLVERLQDLPGFDHQALSKAMAESGNSRVVCWRRQN